MTRTQHSDKPASSSQATDPPAAPVEAVLPEHVALRMLQEQCAVTGNSQPNIEHALQLASLIAANQSLESIQEYPANNGSKRPLDDDVSEEAVDECFDLSDLVEELNINSDIKRSTKPTDRSEAETVSKEHNLHAASNADPNDAVPGNEQQELDAIDASEANDDEVADSTAEECDEQALGAIVGDSPMEPTASEKHDEPRRSIEVQGIDRQFEDAELGALMTDIGGSGVDPEEEQQELQDVFGDPGEAKAEIAVAAAAAERATEPENALDPASGGDRDTDAKTAERAQSPAIADPLASDGAQPVADDDAEPVIIAPAEATLAAEPSLAASRHPKPTADVPAANASPAPSSASDEEFALTNNTVDRVQDFLGDLKSALVEMAHRTQPAVDVEPLVEAVQAGFNRSAEQAAQTSTAVASLSEHMTQFGRNIEGGVEKSIDTMQRAQTSGFPATGIAPAPAFVSERSTSQAVVLGAISLIVLGWSILFWIKTGSPRLAFGTLIGANAVACCLLLSRRNRH